MGGSGIIANVCTGVVAVVALITALVFKGKAKEAEKALRDAAAQIEEQSKQLKELGTMDKKLEAMNKKLEAQEKELKNKDCTVTGELNDEQDEKIKRLNEAIEEQRVKIEGLETAALRQTNAMDRFTVVVENMIKEQEAVTEKLYGNVEAQRVEILEILQEAINNKMSKDNVENISEVQ